MTDHINESRDSKSGLLDLIELLEKGFVVYGEDRFYRMSQLDKARIVAAQSSLQSIKHQVNQISDYGVKQ